MHTPLRRLLQRPLLAALALTFGFAAPARADQIDKVLFSKGNALIADLRKDGVKNVGILKFQVEKGTAAPSYFSGKLNTLMATRLENALLLAQQDDADRPESLIGITRGASAAAGKRDNDAQYDDAAGRAKLFEGTYPLAWGKDEVKVDAFLTGVVQLSKDYTETTVIVRRFDAKNPEPREVLKFTVPTSRLMLADMDAKFLVTKRELNSLIDIKLPADKVEESVKAVPMKMDQAVVQMVELDERPTPVMKKADESLDQVLEFKIFYGENEVKRGFNNRVATPTPDTKVKFTMKSNERIGVVLRVNGVNTAGGDTAERDADQYAMWVLDPGKLYTIEGFYKDQKLQPFKVLAQGEQAAYKLADETKRGKIELFLFRQVQVPANSINIPDMKMVNIRESPPPQATAALAVAQVMAMMGPRDRTIMVPAEEARNVAVNQVPFNNVELAGHLTITYFEQK